MFMVNGHGCLFTFGYTYMYFDFLLSFKIKIEDECLQSTYIYTYILYTRVYINDE